MKRFHCAVYDLITSQTWLAPGDNHALALATARRAVGLDETKTRTCEAHRFFGIQDEVYDKRFLLGYMQDGGRFVTRDRAGQLIRGLR